MLKDLSLAVRFAKARFAFTIAAISTLAIGIGAATAIFSAFNAVLLRPLPYPEPEDLYSLGTARTDSRFTSGLVAPVEVMALNSLAPSVVGAALVRRADTTITEGEASLATDPNPQVDGEQDRHQVREPARMNTVGVTEGFFELFGLPLLMGGGFTADDHHPVRVRIGRSGPPPTLPAAPIVLAHGVWRDHFGQDRNILGKAIQVGSRRAIVAGVASPDFDVPAGTDVWRALRLNPESEASSYMGYLRARPGTTRERLESEMAAVMSAVAEQLPASNGGRTLIARPLVEAIVGDLRAILVVVMSASLLLLLLACVNVSILLLSRGVLRTREIAVRTAFGAARYQIVRQLMTEALVLAAGGTVAGLFVAYIGIRTLLYFGAATLPRLEQIPFDGRMLVFTLVVLVVTTLLIGLTPASRLSRPDVREALSEGGRGATAGRTAHRVLTGMIVIEIAVAITLVSGAAWLVQSFSNLSSTDPGFTVEGRLVFDVSLPAAMFGRVGAFDEWSRDLETIQGSAGVTAVGWTSVVPLREERDIAYRVTTLPEVDDRNRNLTARLRRAGPGFFKAMGIRILAGREFSTADRTGAANLAVVNRTFAERFLSGKDPLSAQFHYGSEILHRRIVASIVGLVDDVRYISLNEPAEPTFYVLQGALEQTVVVASSLRDPSPIVANVRSAVRALDATLPVHPVLMTEVVSDSTRRHRLGMTLMLLLGAAAVGLAGIGIHGALVHTTAQRLGEVATRMALGATPVSIFWLIMKQGRTGALFGTGAGLGLGYLSGRFVSSQLFVMSVLDLWVLLAGAALVVAITSISVIILAARASQIDLAGMLKLE